MPRIDEWGLSKSPPLSVGNHLDHHLWWMSTDVGLSFISLLAHSSKSGRVVTRRRYHFIWSTPPPPHPPRCLLAWWYLQLWYCCTAAGVSFVSVLLSKICPGGPRSAFNSKVVSYSSAPPEQEGNVVFSALCTLPMIPLSLWLDPKEGQHLQTYQSSWFYSTTSLCAHKQRQHPSLYWSLPPCIILKINVFSYCWCLRWSFSREPLFTKTDQHN